MSKHQNISAAIGLSSGLQAGSFRGIPRALLGSALLLFCTFASSAEEDQWNPVLVTEFGAVMVRPAPFLSDQRYRFIEASIMTHSAGQNAKDYRWRTMATYVVDCEVPRRSVEIDFAVNSQPFNVPTHWDWLKMAPNPFAPKDLPFQSMSAAEDDFGQRLGQQGIAYGNNLPNVVSVISEYVCRVKQEGDTPRNVGASTNSTGGFDDMKELSCAVEPMNPGDRKVDWEFGFSEKGDAIIFGGIWQSTAFVSEDMLAFRWTPGDSVIMDMRISRSTGVFTGTIPNVPGGIVGACVVATKRPKMF